MEVGSGEGLKQRRTRCLLRIPVFHVYVTGEGTYHAIGMVGGLLFIWGFCYMESER